MAIPPQEPGQTVYPVRNSNGHNYVIGKAYIVAFVDNDGTFKAKDAESSIEGNWLKWDDVSLTPPLGWIWLKGQLPKNVVNILSLFSGVEELILKEEYKDLLLQQLPDLLERLEMAGRQVEKSTKSAALASFKSTKANILSFPGNNGGDTGDDAVGTLDEMEDMSIDEEMALQGMFDMLEENDESSKNSFPVNPDGKDSQGNNLPDDD